MSLFPSYIKDLEISEVNLGAILNNFHFDVKITHSTDKTTKKTVK